MFGLFLILFIYLFDQKLSDEILSFFFAEGFGLVQIVEELFFERLGLSPGPQRLLKITPLLLKLLLLQILLYFLCLL